MEEMYHPIMTIGCEIEKRIRRAIFISSAKFDMRANARDTALTAITLQEESAFRMIQVAKSIQTMLDPDFPGESLHLEPIDKSNSELDCKC